jgi:hypothetical protein
MSTLSGRHTTRHMVPNRPDCTTAIARSDRRRLQLVDRAAPVGLYQWCISPKIELRWSNPHWRLRTEGFADVKLVVPCEETVARSLAVAETILADEHARPFVGAIGYHCYPTVRRTPACWILMRQDGPAGPQEIEPVNVANGPPVSVPLRMTEVSHSRRPCRSTRPRPSHPHRRCSAPTRPPTTR